MNNWNILVWGKCGVAVYCYIRVEKREALDLAREFDFRV